MGAERNDIGERARIVIARLDALERERPLDRSRAEQGLANYLRALGLDPRPVHWVTAEIQPPTPSEEPAARREWERRYFEANVRDGLTAAWIAEKAHKRGSLTRKALKDLSKEAARAEKHAGWALKRAAHKAGKAAAEEAEVAVKKARALDVFTRAVPGAKAQLQAQRHGAAKASAWVGSKWDQAAEANLLGPLLSGPDPTPRLEAWKADAAHKAAPAAEWLARAHTLEAAGRGEPAVDRMAEVFLPLVDAVEAGLCFFWITPEEVLAVAARAPADGSSRDGGAESRAQVIADPRRHDARARRRPALILVRAAIALSALVILSITLTGCGLTGGGDENFIDFGDWGQPGYTVSAFGDLWAVTADLKTGGYLARVDPRSRKVVARIGVRPVEESQFAVSDQLLWMLVWVRGGNGVALDAVNPQTNRVVRSFPLDSRYSFVSGLYLAGANRALFVSSADWLLKIDPRTGKVVDSLAGWFGSVATAGDSLWTVEGKNQLWRIDQGDLTVRQRTNTGPVDAFEVRVAGGHVVVYGVERGVGENGTDAIELVSFDASDGSRGGFSSASLLTEQDESNGTFTVAGQFAWLTSTYAGHVYELDAGSLHLRRTLDLDKGSHIAGLAVVNAQLWASDLGSPHYGKETENGTEIKRFDGNGMRLLAAR